MAEEPQTQPEPKLDQMEKPIETPSSALNTIAQKDLGALAQQANTILSDAKQLKLNILKKLKEEIEKSIAIVEKELEKI